MISAFTIKPTLREVIKRTTPDKRIGLTLAFNLIESDYKKCQILYKLNQAPEVTCNYGYSTSIANARKT